MNFQIKKLIYLAYFLLPVSAVGLTLAKNPPVLLWLSVALADVGLLAVKNRWIVDPNKKLTVILSDAGMVIFLMVLLIYIPWYWGLIKPLILAVVGSLYLSFMIYKFFT